MSRSPWKVTQGLNVIFLRISLVGGGQNDARAIAILRRPYRNRLGTNPIQRNKCWKSWKSNWRTSLWRPLYSTFSATRRPPCTPSKICPGPPMVMASRSVLISAINNELGMTFVAEINLNISTLAFWFASWVSEPLKLPFLSSWKEVLNTKKLVESI